MAKSLAAWKKRKRHTVTLPSGAEVDIELPNLPALIKAGEIPNSLIEAASSASNGGAPTQDLLEQQATFTNKMVSLMVKDPEITPEQVEDLPYEDIDMLMEFALRQRDLDALGNHIGGLTVPQFQGAG